MNPQRCQPFEEPPEGVEEEPVEAVEVGQVVEEVVVEPEEVEPWVPVTQQHWKGHVSFTISLELKPGRVLIDITVPCVTLKAQDPGTTEIYH